MDNRLEANVVDLEDLSNDQSVGLDQLLSLDRLRNDEELASLERRAKSFTLQALASGNRANEIVLFVSVCLTPDSRIQWSMIVIGLQSICGDQKLEVHVV